MGAHRAETWKEGSVRDEERRAEEQEDQTGDDAEGHMRQKREDLSGDDVEGHMRQKR